MQSHSALPYFHIFYPYRKWVSFLKFTVYIVKIDKNRNPLKSIAENDFSLSQCIWTVCTTPELVCGGGGEQGIETPCTLHVFFEDFVNEVLKYIGRHLHLTNV